MLVKDLSNISHQQWLKDVNKINSKSGLGENKLCTYRLFKQDLLPELYVTMNIKKKYRRALALFRSGTAPINIELKRYSSVYVPVIERKCIVCNEVESECHVLLNCPLYADVRDELYRSLSKLDNVCFNSHSLSDNDKLCFLLSSPHCIDVARACYEILDRRNLLAYF